MFRLKTLSYFLIILIISSISVWATPVSDNGKLQVIGLQLSNQCGTPVQLRGVSTHGLQWYSSCYTTQSLDFAANIMNADVFRLAMYVDEGGYETSPATYTTLVDNLVDEIGARGMYAIIDWHMLTPGDPNAHLADAETFWQHEATQHKGKSYVIYEICNEPNGVDWATVKAYADDIIPKIRAIDPDTVIICGTPNYSQLGADVAANPLSYPNVMYTFHFYAGTHNTGLLTPYVGELPIFCTEWASCKSDGKTGNNFPNAQSFLDIMNGANSAGVKISTAAWSLSDNNSNVAGVTTLDASSLLNLGTCGSQIWNVAALSTEGQFVAANITNPAKNFSCWTPSPTVTGTPPTITVTPSITATSTITDTFTVTLTPVADLVYDGDTLGYRLQDGSLNTPAGSGGTSAVIAETAGGNTGKAMQINYYSAGGWEQAQWTSPKRYRTNRTYIQFDIKMVYGPVQNLKFIPDWNTWNSGANIGPSDVAQYVPGGVIDGTWRTAVIPISAVYSTLPSYITQWCFVNNSSSDYAIMIDNIKFLDSSLWTATPTPTITVTSTRTSTKTLTPTRTNTPTQTLTETITLTITPSKTSGISTPTITVTPTQVPTASINSRIVLGSVFPYPNPGKGNKFTIRYVINKGMAKNVVIYFYTFGDRKFDVIKEYNKGPGVHDVIWRPKENLSNGLYYYTVHVDNGRDGDLEKSDDREGAIVVLH